MGRGRGKGKRESVVADHDDTGSGEDEKLQVRRRGRPQKLVNDDVEEEENDVKIEKEHDGFEETKESVLVKSTRNQAAAENGRKRKRPSQVKEKTDSIKEENLMGATANANDLIKPVGYRQIKNRRKNKPRRAAEVGVECK